MSSHSVTFRARSAPADFAVFSSASFLSAVAALGPGVRGFSPQRSERSPQYDFKCQPTAGLTTSLLTFPSSPLASTVTLSVASKATNGVFKQGDTDLGLWRLEEEEGAEEEVEEVLHL